MLYVLLLAACGLAGEITPTPAVPVISESRTRVEGRLIPQQNAVLSFGAPGRVQEVLVPEGSDIKKGDVIARLEGTQKAQAAITAAELNVVIAQKALIDLNEKAQLAASDAEMAVALAQQELKDANKKREDLNYKRVHKYMLEGIQAQLTMAEKAVEDAEEAYSFVQDRGEDDVDRARAMAYLSQTRLARDQVQRNLEFAEGPPASQDIAEADARVSKAIAALEDAQRIFSRRKDGPDPQNLAIAEFNVDNAKAQLDAAFSVLADLEIAAPFDGTVIANDLEIGEIATIGQVIVGDTSAWQVETIDLKEVDVVGIYPGQEVVIRFDAIPELEIAGFVNRVRGYGVPVRGDNTYTVIFDLNSTDPRLLWNMTVRVIFPRTSDVTENP